MDTGKYGSREDQPVVLVKRQRMSNFNWAACIFCQQTTPPLSIGLLFLEPARDQPLSDYYYLYQLKVAEHFIY